MLGWVEQFEIEFSIKKIEENQPFLIIEGECRYLQAVGGKALAIEVAEVKQFFNQNGCTAYDEFDVVSFLVKDWIKIQDSLEMLFNLVTGDFKRSLRVLSYLRYNDIPAHEFALYLYSSRRIVLVNRFTHPAGNERRESQLPDIKKLIGMVIKVDCHVLIVGDRGYEELENLEHVVELGRVLHPSGVVLNMHSADYYKTWYQFDDKVCRYTTDGFSLSNFHRI